MPCVGMVALRSIAVVTILLTGLAGCGTTTSSAPSCTGPTMFAGHPYRDAGPGVEFEVAGRLGTSTYPPCRDTGGSGNTLTREERTIVVYRVVGLAPDDGLAIQSGSDPGGYRLLGRSTGPEPSFTPTFEAFLAAHPSAAANPTSSTSSLP